MAHMCFACVAVVATKYGVNKSDAGFVQTALENIAGYFAHMPGAGKLSEREKVRILLLKMNIPILEPTDLENRGAEWMEKRKEGGNG